MYFMFRDDDGWPETVEAATVEAAIGQMRSIMQDADYDTSEGTVWYTARLYPVDDDGEESDDPVETITMAFDPPEPDCSDAEHDWQSPYEVLGGIKENPGVWGKGGGVVIREVCANCGRYRVTDTWAQRGDTGEQGLQSTDYEDADEASEDWVASLHDPLLADVLEG